MTVRVALLCATRRGYLFLERLSELLPQVELTVVTFREDPHEPPFLDDIHRLTQARGARFLEARHTGKRELREFWESSNLDLMFTVSWRYLIPPEVYHRPRLGAFVFHDSLLPAYRGFAPTVWAIINGEDHTGVSLFEMSNRFDEGPIVDQQRVPIDPDDTITKVMDQVTQAYLVVLERCLPGLLAGAAPRHPQNHALATYTCKRLPEDNCIDWNLPADSIYNLVRAVTRPYPGAYTYLNGQLLRVWAARRLPAAFCYIGRVPGRVVEIRPGEGAVVLAGDKALLLTEVQIEGRDAVCASEILNSLSQTLGT